MEADKILSAQLIDIVFDGRNKDYGAYTLRKFYEDRLMLALIVTFTSIALAFGAASLLHTNNKKAPQYKYREGHILTNIPNTEKKKQVEKPQLKPQQAKQSVVKSVIFTKPIVVNKEILTRAITPQEDLNKGNIDVTSRDGIPAEGTVIAKIEGKGSETVSEKTVVVEDSPPFRVVEVPAKFSGNWVNFLLKNLNANVPVDNGTPAGTYSVIIQFVVDKEGAVSDVKALTAHGYGLEQEAIRVIRKSSSWEAAIQNGFKVKAYHRQVITFQVQE